MVAGGSVDDPFSGRRRPWATADGFGVEAVLSAWRGDGRVARNLALDVTLPAAPARSVPIPDDLAPGIHQALAARGIRSLYAHQADALALGRAGHDLVVATPTASGKSLCYNLPVLERLACDPAATALYLFPTKALARDQELALRGLLHDAGVDAGAVTYDGDTPGDARRAARERCRVLLTNPDMLHAGILPHHAAWARVLSGLRLVVIDELHTYRGVFGSHLANVLRRLVRIARFHGADPKLVFASATIGNPAEHARRMLGRPVRLISESGAPARERHVLLYNPPVVNEELGIRQSAIKAAVRLTADLVRARVPTLLFGQSRNNVEVMLKYLRDRIPPHELDPERIVAYRGGYLPETRRRTEADLRAGDIACVVATNALELGIDIGELDAVVCAGYPGSLAALWQRFGRGGRRDRPSLALLVTSSLPLDQYFAAHPDHLVGAPVEQARIDPDNVEILVQHLKCAAFELPFEQGEAFGDLPPHAVDDALAFLAGHRLVHPVPTGQRTVYHWSSDAYPAHQVPLRSLSWDNVVVIDVERERTIAEMDWRSTHTMLHEQAIYQHEGEQYEVQRLDLDNHKAYVRRVEPDYYTTAMTHTAVTVLAEDETAPLSAGGWTLGTGLGEVSVVEKVVGYKKIKFHTHENVGYGDVRLPEMQMHTAATWITFPADLIDVLQVERPQAVDALAGFGNALHTVSAVGLMTEPRDLGRTVGDRPTGAGPVAHDGELLEPTLYLFDHIPGGVGLSPRIFDAREDLLRRAAHLVSSCVCREGCPGCIGPGTGPARKGVLLDLLRRLQLVP